MTQPIIGITAGHTLLESKRQSQQDTYVGCNRHYVNAVLVSGGAPVIVPPVAERDMLRALLEPCDALMLTGGGDISALLFGAEPHPSIKLLDPMRDFAEIEAIRFALERNLPMLAICRGIQVLNVAMGGDLIQDIPTQVRNHVRHWSSDIAPALSHSIEVEPASLLASLIGSGRQGVNSDHHQSIGRLAEGLKVTARSMDGVIEAVEPTDGRPILAVQFHPERIAVPYPQYKALFDWLVNEAEKYRKKR